jgi:acyl dehydratase
LTLNHNLVGVPGKPSERSWDSTDCLLYALGVGAGQVDPLAELQFTTENSVGVKQQVLPTFATLLSSGGLPEPLGDFNPASFVHAEQAFTLARPLPLEGRVRSVSTVTGMYDKDSAALVVFESSLVDCATEDELGTTRGSIFIRGEGGFGGDRGPTPDWQFPAGDADESVTYRTRPDQALLYRLTGDRNPLHSDPTFAKRGGWDRPILHGMCTYGFTGRALLDAVCGTDPERFLSMEARFSRPVLPGAELTVDLWIDGNTAYFRTLADGQLVLDRGRMTFK